MNANAYASRQRERDEQYRREYAQWVASLPPEERRKLKAKGVDAPSIPGAAGGMSDIASSSRARCEAEDYDAEFDDVDQHQDEHHDEPQAHVPLPARTTPQSADSEFLHDLLRRLVGELVMQDNARLSLECLALVTGLTYDGDSMTAIAVRHGVTRAAVSKRCVELTTALNLNPSRAMRSRSARHSYRKARTFTLRLEA